MSTVTQPLSEREARVTRQRGVSLIWLIPLVTLVIGGWLAWNAYSKRGPTITITFQSGEGLQAGQSHIKHKDVDLGLVTNVALSPDASHVIVTAEMNRQAVPFLTNQTRLWVVTPRLFAGNITGLDTLISGTYVELLPGDSAGKSETHFTGLETPPVLTASVPGHTFLLHTDKVGAVSLGSPVFFRGINVGTVLGWDLGDMAKDVTIHAFVRAPFDGYVHEGSRFWNASGISMKLADGGVQVEMESFRALLLGGVAFDTPEEALTTPVGSVNEVFPLYANAQDAQDASLVRHVEAIGYFPGSVAGLGPGSPVNFHGLRIGQVKQVSLIYDAKLDTIQTPVKFEIDPQRIANSAELEKRTPLANAQFLVAHGMRAQITSSNLLTGEMSISLDFFPNAPAATVTEQDGMLVVPTVAGQFADIGRSVTDLLAKVNQMPIEQIGNNLNALLVGTTALTNGPETKLALASMTKTLQDTQDLLKKLDSGLTPAIRQLPAMTASLEAMLANTNKLVQSTNAGYGENSTFYRDVDHMMAQLSDMIQSLRVLADLLDRHPEALVRGRVNTGTQ